MINSRLPVLSLHTIHPVSSFKFTYLPFLLLAQDPLWAFFQFCMIPSYLFFYLQTIRPVSSFNFTQFTLLFFPYTQSILQLLSVSHDSLGSVLLLIILPVSSEIFLISSRLLYWHTIHLCNISISRDSSYLVFFSHSLYLLPISQDCLLSLILLTPIHLLESYLNFTWFPIVCSFQYAQSTMYLLWISHDSKLSFLFN